jgi:CBS domain-containing protein
MPLQISDIMSTKPVSIEESASIHAAATKMKKYRVSSIIITDSNGKLSGILTVDDIVREAVVPELDMQKPVTDIMIIDVVSVTPDKDVRDVMSLFNEYEIRQAPVLDPQKEVIGFITLKDILRFEPAMLDIAVENLRQEEDNRQEAIQRFVNTQEMPDEDLF